MVLHYIGGTSNTTTLSKYTLVLAGGGIDGVVLVPVPAGAVNLHLGPGRRDQEAQVMEEGGY